MMSTVEEQHQQPETDDEALPAADGPEAVADAEQPAVDAPPDSVDSDSAEADAPTEGATVADADADSGESGEAAAPAQPKGPPPVAEVELVKPGMGWYVLRVASNKESQVQEALERKIKIEQIDQRVGRVLVPTQREKRMRGGTARIYHRKLYPGYVFVEMATEDDGRIPESVWFVIKETTGVGDFIGSGGKPSPMPMSDVEKMLAVTSRQEESPALANLKFKKGDKVKVTEGPFENFEGVVDEINVQKGTVRVVVTIFGRPTPIDIEYWQVE